jgi:DNA-binding NtrC family response regulator
MARILIADQVSERRSILSTFLRGDEHVIIPVGGEEEASRFMREVHPDLLITEGSVGGAKLLSEARELDPNVAVIMILAAPPSVEQVVELMHQGVSDVLVSPLDINDVQAKVDRALNRRASTDALQIRFHDLVGSSQRMQQVFRKIVKASASDVPVLILGEKGVGKQLVAEQIHTLSPRKDRPFRIVYCAALGAAELDGELFGQERGVSGGRRGQFELGEGGTVLLQEVTALTSSLQTKLMRLLDERQLQRVGGDSFVSTDVRILAAASEPILPRVQDETFRSDLFYALSSNLIELPALRARINDIPEIVEHFLARYDVLIAGEAMEMLMNYPWPGNVDELRNAVEQATHACDNNRIELKDLPPRILKTVAATGRRHRFTPRKEPNGPERYAL